MHTSSVFEIGGIFLPDIMSGKLGFLPDLAKTYWTYENRTSTIFLHSLSFLTECQNDTNISSIPAWIFINVVFSLGFVKLSLIYQKL
jgi:hypothetical protein